jgi:hypothetical protein
MVESRRYDVSRRVDELENSSNRVLFVASLILVSCLAYSLALKKVAMFLQNVLDFHRIHGVTCHV